VRSAACICLCFLFGCAPTQGSDTESAEGQDAASAILVEAQTELGNFVLEIYPDKAPNTVSNFLRYVDEDFYEGGRFHRTVHSGNQPNDSVLIEQWRREYNTVRPHSSLGYRPPAPEAIRPDPAFLNLPALRGPHPQGQGRVGLTQ